MRQAFEWTTAFAHTPIREAPLTRAEKKKVHARGDVVECTFKEQDNRFGIVLNCRDEPVPVYRVLVGLEKWPMTYTDTSPYLMPTWEAWYNTVMYPCKAICEALWLALTGAPPCSY